MQKVGLSVFPLLLMLLAFHSCGSESQQPNATTFTNEPLPDCEWCGAQDMPDKLESFIQLAPEDEPGQPMEIRGTVYRTDGVTPAPGVVVYTYHTNAEGVYPKRGDETGNGRRHGYIRGWMKTDEKGQYGFRSIRPQPYPNRRDPAHIHVTIIPPDEPEFWVEATLFEGDPLIPKNEFEESEEAGQFAHIIPLTEDENGVLRGRRDLRMK